MAPFATGGPFLHFGVAFPAFLMSHVLAETINFAAGSGCMTFRTLLDRLDMGLVLEGNALFHLNHVGRKNRSGKCGYRKYGYYQLFHVHSPFRAVFCAVRSSVMQFSTDEIIFDEYTIRFVQYN